MCELVQSPWPLDVRCSDTFGSCVNNFCQCQEAFEHDMSYFRYRDCRQPKVFLPIVDAIFTALSLAAMAYAIKHYRDSKALARKIIAVNIVFCFFCILFGVVRFIQHHQMTGISLFIDSTMAATAMLCFYLSIYSLAFPLLGLSRTSVKGFQRKLIALYIFFRILIFAPVIASFKYTDPTNPANDYSWNLCMSIFAIAASTEILTIATSIAVYGTKMIETIAEIQKDLRAEDKVNTNEYLNRVRNYVNVIKKQIPGLFISCMAQPVIHLTTLYVPYAFALFALQYLTSPSLSQKITNFTTTNNNSHSGEVSPNNSARKDQVVTSSIPTARG